jgi:hypothetical protein
MLHVDDLVTGKYVGSLEIDAAKISRDVPLKFKNVPALKDQGSKEDCEAMHFAALYSLFPNRVSDPVPHASLLCNGTKGISQTCDQWAKELERLKGLATAETSDVSPSCMGAFAVIEIE